MLTVRQIKTIKSILRFCKSGYEVCENRNLRVSKLNATQDIIDNLQQYLSNECLSITFDDGVMVIHD